MVVPCFHTTYYTYRTRIAYFYRHQMSPRVYRNLDEIFAGEYEGLTYEEIKKKVRSKNVVS